MKLFKVKQGTLGTVYPPGKRQSKRNFSTRKELVFEREEMIFDPISLANGQLAKASSFCKSQARKGFAGFRRKNYLLVVPYSKVEVMA